MNILAITTFGFCILSFFAIFVIWILHVLGKVTEKDPEKLTSS